MGRIIYGKKYFFTISKILWITLSLSQRLGNKRLKIALKLYRQKLWEGLV